VTTPFFESESCRSETTLPLLELTPVDDDALESVTFAGNVTYAEASRVEVVVFVIATFTV
jgi:hypothetical protein